MKKTLFLLSVLCFATAGAYAHDVFVPQSIITVQQGDKAYGNTRLTENNYLSSTTESSETVADVFSQKQQFTTNYDKRSAIVKDGQGELEIAGDAGESKETLAMETPLLVREGTLVFRNVAVSNTPKTDGTNMSVSGVNAKLVLDNADYMTGAKATSSSSVIIGATDGDGALVLQNKSSLYSKHNIYLGSNSTLPLPAGADPKWDIFPHRGGSYATIDTEGGENTFYRYETEAAGFKNGVPTSSSGTLKSSATVDVSGGSKMTANYSLYVENATLNIDGEGSQVITGQGNSDNNDFIGNGYGTKSVINITNGGYMETYNQFFMVSASSALQGSDSEINISGAGSQLRINGYACFGLYARDADSTAAVSIDDHAKLYAATLYLGSAYDAGCTDSVTLTRGGMLEAPTLYMFADSSIAADDSSVLCVGKSYIEKGATLTNMGVITGGGVYADAQVNVGYGAMLINQGEMNVTTVVEQGGTLKGCGSMGSATVQGTLVVGNSPGAPVFEDLLLGSTSETVFSIAGVAPATAELSGWENAVYSQITITDGTLTLNEGARFVIEFGGALLYDVGGHQDFTIDLDLVNAADAITLGGDELDTLLGNTTFRIAADSPTGGADWSVNVDFSQSVYSLTNDDTTLHLHLAAHLVPEPATATLSLLALAAFVSRRRRH